MVPGRISTVQSRTSVSGGRKSSEAIIRRASSDGHRGAGLRPRTNGESPVNPPTPSHAAQCGRCGQARIENGRSIVDCSSCGLREEGTFSSTDWMYRPRHRLAVLISWDGPASLRLAHQLKQLVPEFAEASARELVDRLAGLSAWSVEVTTSIADAVTLSEKAQSLGVKAVVSDETLPPLRSAQATERL